MQQSNLPEKNKIDLRKIAGNCSAWFGFLRQRILTRENGWALLIALMLLTLILFGTAGQQPRFVYSGF